MQPGFAVHRIGKSSKPQSHQWFDRPIADAYFSDRISLQQLGELYKIKRDYPGVVETFGKILGLIRRISERTTI